MMCVPKTAGTAATGTTAATSHCPAGTYTDPTAGIPACNNTTGQFAQCWYGYNRVSGRCVPATAATTAATSHCPAGTTLDITIANHRCLN